MIVCWKIRPKWQGANKDGHLILTDDCCFCINNEEYWIPKNYIFDGASIPFFAERFAGHWSDPDNAEPACAHDVVYLTHALNRTKSDEVLYQLKYRHEIMMHGKQWLAKFRARKMWLGVRLFGVLAWKNSKKDLQDLEDIKIIISQREDSDKFKSLWFSKAVI